MGMSGSVGGGIGGGDVFTEKIVDEAELTTDALEEAELGSVVEEFGIVPGGFVTEAEEQAEKNVLNNWHACKVKAKKIIPLPLL